MLTEVIRTHRPTDWPIGRLQWIHELLALRLVYSNDRLVSSQVGMPTQMTDTFVSASSLRKSEFAILFIILCIRAVRTLPESRKKERAESEPRYCCRGQMLHNGLSPFTVAGMAVGDMDAMVYLAGVNAPSINLD